MRRTAPLIAALAACSLAACSLGDGEVDAAVETGAIEAPSTLFDPEATNALEIGAIRPGSTLSIESVRADRAGFVVAYASSSGQPGERLGAAPVEVGSSGPLAIELDRELQPGELVFVVLHLDRGADGELDFPGPDTPVTDAEGSLVIGSGRLAGPEASLSIDDPFVDIERPTLIVSAQAPRTSNLVVRDADGLVVGTLPIAAGARDAAAIALRRAPEAGGEPWTVSLHPDLDDDDAFDGADEEPIVGQALTLTVRPLEALVEPDRGAELAFSTLYPVRVSLPAPAIIALLEPPGARPGAPLEDRILGAVASTSDSLSGAIAIPLARPLQDGESVLLGAWIDVDSDGAITEADRAIPAARSQEGGGAPIVVEIPASLPAAHIDLARTEAGLAASVEPAHLEGAILNQGAATSPALTLELGWRYAFTIDAGALEFGRFGFAPGYLALSGAEGIEGALEDEPSVGWEESEGRVVWSAAPIARDAVSGYRLAGEPSVSAGPIAYAE